ncbi:MAG: DUF2169 domain-containing protein [Polyangiaceae bacterium]|nr:DUF2169 domain-containing protein [Polyangiaceae bacterium]
MTWPISIDEHRPLARAGIVPSEPGSVVWRFRGQLHVTAIVKVTLAFEPDGPMMPADEVEPIRQVEIHQSNNPARSIRATTDTAPYMAKADIVLTGHAFAPPGQVAQSVRVRLAVGRRDGAILDKVIEVRGEKGPQGIKPFQKIPLVYERAFGGIGFAENPIGRGAGGAPESPNLVDPKIAERIACFAPISRVWPQRKRLLRGLDPRVFTQPIVEIPEHFDWTFFQAAPPDQQVRYLEGDEWILLEGVHPAFPSILTRLPGLRALGQVVGLRGPGDTQAHPIQFRADTLVIDADAQRCEVVWRATFPVQREDWLPSLRVLTVVEGDEIPIDEQPAPPAEPPRARRELEAPAPADAGTLVLGDNDVMSDAAPSLPFQGRRVTAKVPPPASPAPSPVQREQPAAAAAQGRLDLGTLSLGDPAFDVAAATIRLAERADERSPAKALPFKPGRSNIEFSTAEPKENLASGTFALSDEQSTQAAQRSATPFYSVPVETLAELPSIDPSKDPSASRWFHAVEAPAEGRAASADVLVSEPEIPERASETIPIVNTTGLAATAVAWQVRPPADSLTIIVKGTFDIVQGAPARQRPEMDLPLGDLHFDDNPHRSVRYPSDYAIFKVKADVLLTGHAYAPGGSFAAAQVSFQLGHKENRFTRRLAVFGERSWKKALGVTAPTAPRPFEKIPLIYERAFGGPGYGRNPVGTGFKTPALPSLEDPASLISSPTDAPAPACFAPIPILWKERWSKLGTYDAKWLKGRWPYFPEDFDWIYFQSAPIGQQLDYLTGDEPFEIAGVHPSIPKIKGSLPGIRARCFLQQTKQAGGRFQEVKLRLDTVVIDADTMKLSLVWRGLVEVSDEDAPEIQSLFVLKENVKDEPAPLLEARALCLRSLIPLSPVAEAEGAPPAANDAPPQEEEEEPEALREIRAQVDAAQKDRAEKLKAAGLADEAFGPKPPEAEASPQAAVAALEGAGAREEDVAALRKLFEPDPEAPPEPTLRDRVLAMRAAGEVFDGMDLQGADLSDLDLEKCSFVGTNLKDVSLKGARLASADLSGAQVGGADLSAAVLDRANLEGADLHEARMEGACFDGARLELTSFRGARGDRSSFRGASGERPVFADGSFADARFDGADLPRADFMGAALDRAVFTGAKLPRALLFKARGEAAVFDGATLTGAGAEGAELPKGSFFGAAAEESSFDKATLRGATFERANLRGASFIRAACQSAVFSGADLREGCLRRAKLAGAKLVKANLMQATLERADLTRADLRGANMHACETWKAKLEQASLDGAIVTQTKLKERR